MKKNLLLCSLACTLIFNACSQSTKPGNPESAEQNTRVKLEVEKSEEEWKKILSPDEFYVLREQGTERAFSGEYWDQKASGTYLCGGCQAPLFSSETKFKSGTGWPSFYQPLNDSCVGEVRDNSHGWTRTEVICNRCGGHLGHVFGDGPQPTGLRYCINSISLDFSETGTKKEP